MKFTVTSTAQVERTYEVEAADEEQAKKRFTAWKHDPDAFAPGLVTEDVDQRRDTTMQKIKVIASPSPPAEPDGGKTSATTAVARKSATPRNDKPDDTKG